MNATITNTRSVSARRSVVRFVAAAVALFLGAGALSATAAHADPVALPNGYQADAAAYVACDNVRHTITIQSVSASAMYRVPMYTPGAYDNGQWVHYAVFISVDNGGWTLRYTWSPWTVVAGMTVNQSTDLHMFPSTQIMPTNAIAFTGARGHSYRILVQIGWYTGGVSPLVNVTPVYGQYQSGYTLHPTGCMF